MAKENKDERAAPITLLAQLTPEKLAEYERVMPNSGRKILEFLEKEQAHYHEKDIFRTKKLAETTEMWKIGTGSMAGFLLLATGFSAMNYAYWLTIIFAVLFIFVVCLFVLKK